MMKGKDLPARPWSRQNIVKPLSLYFLVLIAQICVSNVLLIPFIFDEQCTVGGVEAHVACLDFIMDYDQVGDAKNACIAAKTELGQSYCSFKTECDFLRRKETCELELSAYGLRKCTWREDGFCNATSLTTGCA